MVLRPKRTVIADIEANGLAPTKIWCIVCKDVKTKEVFKFRPRTALGGHAEFKEDFLKFVKEVDVWIGHNFLGYDLLWINKLMGTDIKIGKVIDTLVLSRLLRPVTPFKDQLRGFSSDTRLGGHSLGAWGVRLKFPKIDFHEWDRFSERMLEYCVQDVELNYQVYLILLTEQNGFDPYSVRLEHKVAWLLAKQERNGFYLDQDKAKELLRETTEQLTNMLEKLQEVFPPTWKLVRNYSPPVLKDTGERTKVAKRIIDDYTTNPLLNIEELKDGTYNLFVQEIFNPKSSKQVSARLLGMGWEPRKFTPKGNPATDKVSIVDAIDELLIMYPEYPELEFLKKYNIVADRQQKASKWLELVEDDGRVHGRINPIGAGTHRCSHYADNMANVASVNTKTFDDELFPDIGDYSVFDVVDKDKVFLHHNKKKNEATFALQGLEGGYGWDSRACWSVPTKDHVLVGADASGIQLRGLAHYMNDADYTRKLLKEDIHVVHQLAAGIADRPTAKTFIYAWLLGAGDEKIGTIVGVTEAEYEALISFAANRQIWGKPMLDYIIASLRKKGRKASKRLVCTIIKGFKVKEQFLDRTPALKRLKTEDIPRATKQGYLVGLDGRKLWIPSEHLAMSMYLQGYEAVVMKLAMCLYQDDLRSQNIPFKQVNFVHDEFQIETYKEYGDAVGQAVVDALVKAGTELQSNCPLDGEYKIGRSWAETH